MSSSFIITDEWIQKIVSEARVTHINPRASQVIIPYVEDFARHLALISDKMRRRFHRNVLTGMPIIFKYDFFIQWIDFCLNLYRGGC